MPEQAALGNWLTTPSNSSNTLTVIGVASQEIWREDEILAAKVDAARRVAMFHSLYGVIIHRVGPYSFERTANFEFGTNYTEFIEQLRFDPEHDVKRYGGAVLVRFSYTTRVTPVNFVFRHDGRGRPEWLVTHILPDVPGYIAMVGFAGNQMWLRSTIMQSLENAAERMIAAISTRVRLEQIYVSGFGLVPYAYLTSEAALRNFRVLEFWIDPTNGSVHTLAIARLAE